jgi:hypothetical protein
VSLFWRSLDPSYLFLVGGGYAADSTHRAGVFLLSVMVFLVAGLHDIVSNGRTPIRLALIAGWLIPPAVMCLFAESYPYTIQRELVMVPFAILIATHGVERLIRARQRLLRAVVWGLFVVTLAQAAYFYRDYVTNYPARSAFWFGGNIQGALQEMIATARRDRPGAIYLTTDVHFIDWYWQLSLIEHDRQDLLPHTVYFEPTSLDTRSVPAEALVLVKTGDSQARFVDTGQFHLVKNVSSLDGTTCCSIFEKRGSP